MANYAFNALRHVCTFATTGEADKIADALHLLVQVTHRAINDQGHEGTKEKLRSFAARTQRDLDTVQRWANL